MELESKIEDTPRFLDSKGTPNEFLNWLSVWVGAVRDENWPEEKWRAFLSRASELYKHRGTRLGLSEIIKIFTGDYPFIVEPVLFESNCEYYDFLLGQLFGCENTFCVLLKPFQVKNDTEKRTVKRIIESESFVNQKHILFGIVE